MKKKREPFNQPYSVSYTFSYEGYIKSDGVKTTTPQTIRDQMLNVLEDHLHKGAITKYSSSAQVKHKAEKP